MKNFALIFVLCIAACTQGGGTQQEGQVQGDDDEQCLYDCYPDPSPDAGQPEPEYACQDSCGDGLVLICETGHYPHAHPTQVCTLPEYSDSYLNGSYGYCGLCEYDTCEGNPCQEASINGQIVCRDMFGDEGGPYEVCTDAPLTNGDECGHCPEPEPRCDGGDACEVVQDCFFSGHPNYTSCVDGCCEPQPEQCDITCGSVDCPQGMVCLGNGCCEQEPTNEKLPT